MQLLKSTSFRTQRGLTLVELMVTLAVLAILVTVGVPQFQSVIQGNRAISSANELLGTLQLARSESVKRGRDVLICPSSDQDTCTGNTDWSVGWIVVDTTDPSEPIRASGVLPNQVQITAAVAAVNFNAVGATPDATAFTVTAGATTRNLCVEASGRSEVGACQ